MLKTQNKGEGLVECNYARFEVRLKGRDFRSVRCCDLTQSKA